MPVLQPQHGVLRADVPTDAALGAEVLVDRVDGLGRAGDGVGLGTESHQDGEDQRHDAENEAEGGHQDGAEAETGRGHGRVVDRLAFFPLLLGELHDQDGGLRHQTDEQHQSHLCVDVVVQPPELR